MPKKKKDKIEAFAEPLESAVAAKEAKPDMAEMGSFLTPAQAFGTMIGGQSRQGDMDRAALWRSFQNGNPARYTQQIRASQSASSAHQFWFLDSPELYDLLDEMMDKDRTIGATLSLIVATVLGREQRFEVDDEEDAQAAEIAEACRQYLMGLDDDFGWDAMRWTMTLGMLAHGFSVNEIIWESRDGLIAPKMFMHRHPGQFAFDALGTLYLWRDWVAGGSATPTEEQMILYRRKFALARSPGMYGNPYGRSATFPLRYLYFMKKDILKYWVDWCDKFGTPLLIGSLKDGPAGGATQGTARDALLDELKTIFEELTRMSAVVIKPEHALEKMERAGGQGKTPQQALIEWFDGQIIKSLAGATLQIQEAEFGTRAQAEVHQSTGNIMIRPIAKLIEAAINRGIVAPFVEMNFGPDAPKPRYRIDTDEEIDVEQAIKIIEAAGKNGVEFTLRQFREWLGVNARVGAEPVIEPRHDPVPFGSAAQTAPVEDALDFTESAGKKKLQSTRIANGASSPSGNGSLLPSLLKFRNG